MEDSGDDATFHLSRRCEGFGKTIKISVRTFNSEHIFEPGAPTKEVRVVRIS